MSSTLLSIGLLCLGSLLWIFLLALLHEHAQSILPRGKADRRRTEMLAFLVLTAALCAVYISPSAASEFPVSDAIEYSLGGLGIAEHGTYTLTLNGTPFPPRYSPWFSLFFLAPLYIVNGSDPGMAIIVQSLFLLVAMRAAFLVGFQFSGNLGGVLGSMALLTVTGFRYFSQQIMTDLPVTALSLIALGVFLRLISGETTRHRLFLSAGILVGLAGALRTPGFTLVTPFLFLLWRLRPQKLLTSLLQIVLPSLIILGLTAAYQQATFGSWARSGYNYWVAVPYDFPSLTFSTTYALKNSATIFVESGLWFWVLLIGFASSIRFRSNPFRAEEWALLKQLGIWCILSGAPLILMYTFYFYASLRFYLPVTTSAALIGAACIASCVQTAPGRTWKIGLALLIVAAGTFGIRYALHRDIPGRRHATEQIRRHCSPQTTVISSMNPAYLEHFLKENCGEIVPLSRRTEYASKMTSTHFLTEPIAFSTPWETLRPHMERQGARVVYAQVATERGGDFEEPVLLHTRETSPEEVEQMKNFFRFETIEPELYSLHRLP